MQGDASVDDIIYSPGIERLAIVPNFQAIADSSEMLTTPRMTELLQALERETPRRIIIFDLPPLLASDDVIAFAPQIDSMLLVVAEGATNRAALESAKETLSEMNLLVSYSIAPPRLPILITTPTGPSDRRVICCGSCRSDSHSDS